MHPLIRKPGEGRTIAVVYGIEALDLTPKVVAALDAGLPPEAPPSK